MALTAAVKGSEKWVIFNDPTNGDFSLKSVVDGLELNDAIGAGVDLSAQFTTDIVGTTRSAWDIGAYEYILLGPASPWGHYFFGIAPNTVAGVSVDDIDTIEGV